MPGSTASQTPAFDTHLSEGTAQPALDPITVLIVVPTLDGGAADNGALELVRILMNAGHRAIVVSRAGRLVADVTAAGGEFVALDVGINNPIAMLRNALARRSPTSASAKRTKSIFYVPSNAQVE